MSRTIKGNHLHDGKRPRTLPVARPDEKIGRELPKKSMIKRAITSTQNRVMKHVSAKKRRQHGKKIVED
jgi:hypothetical protein